MIPNKPVMTEKEKTKLWNSLSMAANAKLQEEKQTGKPRCTI